MKKILIIFGGNSFEHEISILSVNNVIKNIDTTLFDFDVVGIDLTNRWFLVSKDKIDKNWREYNCNEIENIVAFLKQYDLVFPVMHGMYGEDGRIQSFLELFNIRYVGSNSASSRVAMDKYLTKIICRENNIKQVDYKLLIRGEKVKLDFLDFPVIVKPANGGSSIGISVANNKKEAIKAIREAFNYDTKVLVEKFINCLDLECAIIEGRTLVASTVGMVVPSNQFYDYEAKYEKPSKIMIPADIDSKKIKEIQEMAKKIFKILNLKDFARIDFLYDKKNDVIYFNEVNTIPGFTDVSMFPNLFVNKNWDFKSLLTKIFNN